MDKCLFCLSNNKISDEVIFQNNLHYFVKSIDPILSDSGMIIPVRHVETPFELSPEEWISLQEMILKAKAYLDDSSPDGYNMGWNIYPVGGQEIPHAHLHIIGRFKDEPLAGKGIRSHLKDISNKRK